jgi:hypothetical protein
MQLVYVLGTPGAGKTTTMLHFRKTSGLGFTEHKLQREDVPPELGEVMKSQTISYERSSDGGVVILGVFPDPTDPDTNHELSGSDRYTQPQRTRLKAVIQHFKSLGDIHTVITDGFATINKPFMEQAQLTFESIHVVMLTTPHKVCEQRFKDRNIKMWMRRGDKARVEQFKRHSHGEAPSARIQKKTQMVQDVADSEVEVADYKEAFLKLMDLCGYATATTHKYPTRSKKRRRVCEEEEEETIV